MWQWAAGMPAYPPLVAAALACHTCLDQAVLLATMLDVRPCLMLVINYRECCSATRQPVINSHRRHI